MRIMLTNDDGIDAPGLHALLSVLERHGDVTVIAPGDGQSATSHSLSFSRPLLVSEKEIPGWQLHEIAETLGGKLTHITCVDHTGRNYKRIVIEYEEQK